MSMLQIRRSPAPANADHAELPPDILMRIRDLWIEYRTPAGMMQAVRGVNLDIRRGEALALIGESGSGKSTLGLGILRLLARTARIPRGTMRFRTGVGHILDILKLGDNELRHFRWEECSMVFQSALNALNPVLRVVDHFVDTARAHGLRNNHRT